MDTMNLGWTTTSTGSSKTTLLMGTRTLDTAQHSEDHCNGAALEDSHDIESESPWIGFKKTTALVCLISASLSLGYPNTQQPFRSPPLSIDHSPFNILERRFMSSPHYACSSVVTDQDINNKTIICYSHFTAILYRAGINIVRNFIKTTLVAVPKGLRTNQLSITTGIYTPTITPCPQDFPPPPAVLGSQPLYYLAQKFPILAEHELKMMPNKTALDYSCFIIGAMSTSYPSATTLRAVIRQFRNFIKESARQLKTTSTTAAAGDVSAASYASLELPRARIWAQAIRGLIWMKQYRRARVAIHAMQKLKIKPTGFAWRGICRGWIEEGQLDRAEALAVKVFRKPEISHDYLLDERPYYYTDMQTESILCDEKTKVRQKHRSPMRPNSAPLFLVIEALAECGEMERARHWFDQIPQHELTDLLTSAMVAGYLRVDQKEKSQEVIQIMARCGVKPTAIVFNPLVEHAVKNVGMEAAEDLVKVMTNLRIFSNLFTFRILVRGYIAAGQKDKALECLDRMRSLGVETDRGLGRIFLKGLWQIGELHPGDNGPSAICVENRTPETKDGLRLEDLSFVGKPGWGQRCIKWIQGRNVELAEEALHLALDLEPSRFDFEGVHVIMALANKQEMARARHWFNRLMSPHCIESYRADGRDQNDSALVDLANRLVSGYIRARQPSDAQAVIGIMSQQGIRLTVETTNLILRWTTMQEEMEDAEGLAQRMAQSGILPNQETFEILCQGYASRGSLESLQDCLTRMEEAGFGGRAQSRSMMEIRKYLLGQQPFSLTTSPASTPAFSAPSIIDSLCARWIEQDQMTRAEEFISHLASNPNVPPSMIPYATLIQGWIDQSQRYPISSAAIQAIAQPRINMSSSEDLERQSVIGNSASSSVPSSESFDREVRIGQENVMKMRKARYWFDQVPEQERTLDLLNRMINGYMTLGQEYESEELILWMASREIKPNIVTYNHILEHTIQRLNMSAAEGLVRQMLKGGIEPNLDTWNLLIRGYALRGELKYALQCLDIMTGKVHDSTASTSAAAAMGARSSKSKKREIIEGYDRETLDVAVESGEESDEESYEFHLKDDFVQHQQRRFKMGMSSKSVFQPNEVTEQLILSGFGSDFNPLQGQGDCTRALELYKERSARQGQQKEQLLQTLSDLKPHSSTLSSVTLGAEGGDEDEWVLDQFEASQNMDGLLDSEAGMTDIDWKDELKWEELMEVERRRERELSGRSSYTY
ncbi:hypothetical protein BGZ50_002974 [Haplosporangium sp. Z 11]|nr:hypothetical protein BGZ50_002974 [Haplosporangium sp. Z 11]